MRKQQKTKVGVAAGVVALGALWCLRADEHHTRITLYTPEHGSNRGLTKSFSRLVDGPGSTTQRGREAEIIFI